MTSHSASPARQETRVGTYNHTGQVVTDLERSKRFYQEVFGFQFWYEISPPDEPTAKLSSPRRHRSGSPPPT